MHIDGLIAVRGMTGTSIGGGGSGGSILIRAYNISGHGILDASGGGAFLKSGGGSGGKLDSNYFY